jgi:hypothetical protein
MKLLLTSAGIKNPSIQVALNEAAHRPGIRVEERLRIARTLRLLDPLPTP